MDWLLAQDYATSFFLHVMRAGAFFAVAPLFGQQADSLILRLVLAIALGGVFWWVGEQSVAVPGNLLALGVIAMREVLIGIALGFALSTLTALLTAAGELISSEMGFSMARTINPESGVDASVVSQLLQVLGFLLILQLDLHHDALRILQQTFVACPIGQPFDILPIWEGLRVLVAGTVQLSVQYGFPILGLMLLLSLGMVLLGRAVPAINLQEFGFALRIVLGLGSLAFFLVEGAPFLVHTFHSLLETTAAMFPG
jgi:flagellar biosynthetic protein FliR